MSQFLKIGRLKLWKIKQEDQNCGFGKIVGTKLYLSLPTTSGSKYKRKIIL
jgi:hypothetical protein